MRCPNVDCIYPSMHGLSNYNVLPVDVTKLMEKWKNPQDWTEFPMIYPPNLRWSKCPFSHRKSIVKDNKISISSAYCDHADCQMKFIVIVFIIFLSVKTRSL